MKPATPKPVTLSQFLQWKADKRKIALILEDVMEHGMDKELQEYLKQCVAEQKDAMKVGRN